MANGARAIPKTSAVEATGTCGHYFKNRYPVPKNLIGKSAAGEFLDRFQLWKEQTAKVVGCAECPDCQASRLLSQTREALDSWSQWLGVPPLPHLDPASVKALAFAESARAAAIQTRVSAISTASAETFKTYDMASRILSETLKAKWPQDNWINPNDPGVGSPAGYFLKETFPVGILSPMSLFYGRSATPQQTLALWILNRASWPDAYSVFFSERRAQAWIAMKRSRRVYSEQVAERGLALKLNSDLFACRITAQLGHWQNPNDAWDFFIALRSPEVASMVGDALAGEEVHSLPGIVQMGSSMAAISGMNTDSSVADAKISRILGKI